MYCTFNGQIPGQTFKSNRSWSVTECKMPKMRRGCIWFNDLNSLVRGGNSSKIKKNKQQTFWFFLNQSDPKILHCAIECVTLCWSASEGLSPQLGKEASLLPSNTIHTLLHPPSHPSTVLQCTPILTPPLLLLHRSMGDYVWCYDQCMSAACPDKHHSLSSLCLLGRLRLGDALMHHHQKMTTPAEEVIVEAGRAQCTNTLSCSLDQCISLYNTEEKHCCTNIKHTHIVREFFVIDGVWLDLCLIFCGKTS